MQARYELWAGLLQNAVIQLGRCVYSYVFILKIDMDLKKCILEMRPLETQSRWPQKIFLMHKIFARILNIWCVKTFSEHLITDLLL